MIDKPINPIKPISKNNQITWLIGGGLIVVLILAATLRMVGLYWGENTYNHPDERFLLFVGTDIKPVESFQEYWDTEKSTLNPHNRGHRFYVYGTLPMFLVRYVVEWNYGHSGINEVLHVGRALSALFDFLTVFMVYLLGAHLYGRRVGLLASAFSAFAVLQIQQAHFFTMDTFTNFFAVTAIYFAVRVASDREKVGEGSVDDKYLQDTEISIFHLVKKFFSNRLFILCLGFGIAMGMALASKVNSAPVAFLLPIAMLIRLTLVPGHKRRERFQEAVIYVVFAAVISFFVFRIFQPYAFMGPGFWGLRPNMEWIENIQSQARMASGDVDFPPAIQWARRPIWFAWQNMVMFGMGLPLGLLAWAGFFAISWQIIKGAWQRHLLLWGWTAVYFTWQSLVFNPSMRYQLLVYPSLAIFAAWGIIRLYDRVREKHHKKTNINLVGGINKQKPGLMKICWKSILVVILGFSVLLTTGAYAFAFTGVYTNQLTRAEASRWIFQNIPGAINLRINNNQGVYNQPLQFPYGYVISHDKPFNTSFQPQVDGVLENVYLPSIFEYEVQAELESLSAFLYPVSESDELFGVVEYKGSHFTRTDETEGNYLLSSNPPVYLLSDQPYILKLELPFETPRLRFCGKIILRIYTPDGFVDQKVDRPTGCLIQNGLAYQTVFIPRVEGELLEINLNGVSIERSNLDPIVLHLVLSDQQRSTETLTMATVTVDPSSILANPGKEVWFSFEQPVHLSRESRYNLELRVESDKALRLAGIAVANEGAWDDGLPFRVDGYDGFGGIYQPGLNFDMYETDNPTKLARYLRILDQAEYIFISSNRQWGSLPRLPERFPMNTEYFRRLLGCPPERSIEWCYNIAKPGTFQGDLGFEFVEEFHAQPTIGPVRINTQFAEEAFTVYDHPKVFIFKKSEDYDPEKVRAILGAVDLSKVVHITPKQASSMPKNMMLPADRLKSHREEGTWSELFNSQALYNRWPVLGVIVWYLAVSALGLITYPVIRLALAGLPDRGYPLARVSGLLISSYLVWVAGSANIIFNRTTISVVIIFMFAISAILAFRHRKQLCQEWNSNRRYYLIVEILFLAFFIIGLLIRIGNPDLWHPSKGGEKPMDFSYFNAVLKSSSFPPYDPWFAGGYINYYYYGFVLVGVMVKWLGIIPSVAINLILPTLFSLIAMGAFSVTWNLIAKKTVTDNNEQFNRSLRDFKIPPFIPAIGAALGMVVLGNLGTLRMIFHGLQKLGAPEGVVEGAGIFNQFIWTVQGFIQVLLGSSLPYIPADWYWIPSRAIPVPSGEIQPITEFPFFTVLYADPHAHLFALPLTLLGLAWAVSVVLGKGDRIYYAMSKTNKILGICLSLLVGGLAIGVLRPTNTWDLPTYLVLGILAVGYSIGRYYALEKGENCEDSRCSPVVIRVIAAFVGMVALTGIAFLLFQPYAYWYVPGYTAVEFWEGSRTPFWSYLTHWGFFLFVIVGWMLWETREWMASTPLSKLRNLVPYRWFIISLALILMFAVIILLSMGVRIAWLVLPVAAWSGLLILRPGMPDTKRVALFLVGTGLTLTLLVEVVRLQGDIGRMNTVFKFYLQSWTLFAVSAAAALGWLLSALPEWKSIWRKIWVGTMVALVTGAALFPWTASAAKISDRMAADAPPGLDGMVFMQYSTYFDADTLMDLSQDYDAIRWLQENVEGSPVIVEANMPEYRWGTRYTVYTGLPNVIGWNWHQRQQRPEMHEDVWRRVAEVGEFYITTNLDEAAEFLENYDVRYIILGQLERAYYYGPGLQKFDQYDGVYWQSIYRNKETVIYEVRHNW